VHAYHVIPAPTVIDDRSRADSGKSWTRRDASPTMAKSDDQASFSSIAIALRAAARQSSRDLPL
jgi:hypothetical protein